MEFLGNGIEVTSLPASGVDRGNKSIRFQARSVGHDPCPEKQFDQEPNPINLVIAHGRGSESAPSDGSGRILFHGPGGIERLPTAVTLRGLFVALGLKLGLSTTSRDAAVLSRQSSLCSQAPDPPQRAGQGRSGVF
jgi:hypothetical protein